MRSEPVIATPLRMEGRALRRGLPPDRHRQVVVTGLGRRRSLQAARSDRLTQASAVAVAGIAGALDPTLQAGDIVVASEVRDGSTTGVVVRCPAAPLVAAQLRQAGLPVRVGPLVSSGRVVDGARRARLAETGALAVDMESAWLVPPDRPVVVVRVVADTTGGLLDPAVLRRMRVAVQTLPKVAGALCAWADAVGPRTALLAGPRSFCAGVERAIDVVERALDQRGAPVYVRKQIVHNQHVVADLQQRGAVFVDELDEVPSGATTVFSAHGVAPAVWSAARGRHLDVIDATCPLVAKVHSEVRRFGDRGDTVIFIGHAGHEETEGTMGERPDRTLLVEDIADAQTVQVPDPERVSFLVQTTLAVDEVEEIVQVLRARFPSMRAPASDDICYATTNRQEALRAVAADADLVLVIGSQNSSNSRRLVETSARCGTPAYLVDDISEVPVSWLVGAGTVGITAGASAPESLVDDVVAGLRGLGKVTVHHRQQTLENVHFTLPKEVRPA